MMQVQAKQCNSCIFRHPGEFLDGLLKQIADPRMEGFFEGYRECHHAKRGSGVCCRGFWEAHKDDFQLGQVAQRLGFVEFVDDHRRFEEPAEDEDDDEEAAS